jgi:hypothetical protein
VMARRLPDWFPPCFPAAVSGPAFLLLVVLGLDPRTGTKLDARLEPMLSG